ncbi:MAG: 4'-phosphopantetheinyl transferase superfamily protein [Pseudohongiellaceae bacterium]|nr:4'-phosphopantetheinyl transferase superfamily protein [Pseudohongiellaceae bacterium]
MKLDSKQIHLWCIRDALVPDEILPSFLPLLSPEELKRYERFYFDRDKRQFLITRAALRCALSEYFPELEPKQWQFNKNAYGRPEIAGPGYEQAIQFNLSHTTGLIVLAITGEGELGVDVENLSRKCEPAQLADRFFSKVESEALLALDEQGQRERFFDLWTLKESYIKACGMGLAIPLESFSFLLDSGFDIGFTSQREDDCQPWRFWQLQVGEGHRVALAYYGAEGLIPDIVFGSYMPGAKFATEAFLPFRGKLR